MKYGNNIQYICICTSVFADGVEGKVRQINWHQWDGNSFGRMSKHDIHSH